MAKKKEVTVEEKLRALYDLQLIDSRIDEIQSVRGELPLEIEDLEDEVAGLNTRISNLEEDVTNLETDIKSKKNTIAEAEELMKNTTNNKKTFVIIENSIHYQKKLNIKVLKLNWQKKKLKNSKPKSSKRKK